MALAETAMPLRRPQRGATALTLAALADPVRSDRNRSDRRVDAGSRCWLLDPVQRERVGHVHLNP